ncbi:DUF5131 family protein [Rhodobacteraceae bacterium 2CG4]|uniref:DUF5131 family protein n=1 Tax=Halovulum marinum TaxID=2662447 RepID=A0A6L5Z5M0_9RHOB|nr:phage Gp37/Gp68 family protein [Halovulum marinum]MSU91871.1 DUF5131 family protein [Halovulum marinum]
MAENSGIEWTTHTFNPWIGCTKVSPACDHCYAEAWDARFGGERWGPHAPRTRTKSWRGPVKWNREAEGAVERPRVFCASLADVFDNHRSIDPVWRSDLWALVRQTPNLDWLLLTKRPQNIERYLPADWGQGYANVWLGTTIENQEEFDRRAHHLTAIPAAVRFLSMEPLLEPVDLRGAEGLDWIIAGGESGSSFRPADPDWFRRLRDQCAAAGRAFLFKQWGGANQSEIKALGRALDGVVHDGYPVPRRVEAV